MANFQKFFLLLSDGDTECPYFTTDGGSTFKQYRTLGDTEYRNFMLIVVQNLEPVQFQQGTILMDELDELGEMTFVFKGKVGVGYEINKIKKVCI